MRNINELIGIIEGIDFDGVINDKEIDRLQNWIDNNRYLSKDPEHNKLIELVDQVLEDHVIDEQEKEQLRIHCSRVMESQSDDMALIHELNGIIEGIICDGEVNEAEVRKLNEWITRNSSAIEKNASFEELRSVLDEILEDGIVTEEEQNHLLGLLKSRIGRSHLEAKINHLKKKVKEKKNIGMDLIDLIDDDKAVKEIHRRAERDLFYAVQSYSGSYLEEPEIAFVSLVLVGMMNYDGNYYDGVRNAYPSLYKVCSTQKVEGTIRSVLNRFRKNDTKITSSKRVITVALQNAIVPRYFLKSFFEFIYDIYKLNFEYDLSDQLEEDFRFVYEGLRKNLNPDSDELTLNATKKTYKLIKSTQQLIIDPGQMDAIVDLSITVVRLIDKNFWNKEIKGINPYLKQGYEGWIDTFKEDRKRNGNGERSEFRSSWKPKFVLSDSKVYLVPPNHRIKDNYDFSKISISVFEGEKEVFSNAYPDIREIIGGYQVYSNPILLKQPLNKIRYVLYYGNEILYDSKDILFRKYIVFSASGTEISNNTDYKGTAVFCLKEPEKNLETFYSGSGYFLASANVRQGGSVYINQCQSMFSFCAIRKPGVTGDEVSGVTVYDESHNNEIHVFKTVKTVYFECDRDYPKLEVIIDGLNHKISDMKYDISRAAGIFRYELSIENLNAGIHEIKINAFDKGKQKTVLSPKTFLIDPHFKASSEKIDDERYFIFVDSVLLSDSICKEISITELDKDIIQAEKDGIRYTYQIPFNIDAYRIDDGEWKALSEDIWIGDVKFDSSVDIYGKRFDEIQVYDSNGVRYEESIAFIDKGTYLSAGIGFVKSFKASCDYISLALLEGGITKGCLFCYNRCVLNENETTISYDQNLKKLVVLTAYHGRGNVFLTIENSNGKQLLESKILENGQKKRIAGFKSFRKYKINFHEKAKGLSLNKDRIIGSRDVMIFDNEDLKGRTFKISVASFDRFHNGKFKRRRCIMENLFVKLERQNKDEKGMFTGRVLTKNRSKIDGFKKINPVNIEICSDEINGEMEISITKDGDGLLLDYKNNTIMDNLDVADAPDIFSFNMDLYSGAKQAEN